MRRLIREIGRTPVERSTTYEILRRFDDPAQDPPSLEPKRRARALGPDALAPRRRSQARARAPAGRAVGVADRRACWRSSRRAAPRAPRPGSAAARARGSARSTTLDRVARRPGDRARRRGRSRTGSRPCSGGRGTSRAGAGAGTCAARERAASCVGRERRRSRPRQCDHRGDVERARGSRAGSRRACAAPPRSARGRSAA